MNDPEPGQSTTDTAAETASAGVGNVCVNVILNNKDEAGCADRALDTALRAAVRAALDAAGQDEGEVTLVVSGDEEVRALNRDYRGADKPTNVLSFGQPEDSETPVSGPQFLGDVILARETIAREAAEQGKTFSAHMSHLAVHGVLHLLGYTHDNDGDAGRMERLEIAALARLGLPDPYVEPTVLAD